jgi:hypothetical protein
MAAMLLDAVPHVPVLVSRAGHDLVAYGPALAPLLASYTDRVRDAAWVGGALSLEYTGGERHTIIAPEYPGASHSVLADVPAEVSRDVEAIVLRDER